MSERCFGIVRTYRRWWWPWRPVTKYMRQSSRYENLWEWTKDITRAERMGAREAQIVRAMRDDLDIVIVPASDDILPPRPASVMDDFDERLRTDHSSRGHV